MQRIEFSSLKYYNSMISAECLYIGILFNNLDTQQRTFKYISNFNRLKSFDDEIDINFVKLYLKGIKEQVENNLFNSSFQLTDFIRIYVNEFRFTDITTVELDDGEDYVDKLSKLYLKYDYSKKERLTSSEEKRYLKRLLSTNGVQFYNSKIYGAYSESITFDFVLESIAVKFFSFKDKDLKKIISSAKQWSFTADEMKNDKEVVFIYDEEISDPSFEIIIGILSKNAKVFGLDAGIEYLSNKVKK